MDFKYSTMAILFIFIIISIFCGCKRGVVVYVRNNSDCEVRNFEIEYTGSQKVIPDILPGKNNSVIVNPSGESSLYIKYSCEEKSYNKHLDVYFEPNYKGEIIIDIKNQGEVHWESKIGL